MVTPHPSGPTEGQFKPADSFAPVAKHLGDLMHREVPPFASTTGSQIGAAVLFAIPGLMSIPHAVQIKRVGKY